jgi:serine/threonine-protein kinase
MAREVCSGLSFAHRNRIVHGNLRPSNILLTESGEVKITDFGLDDHYACGEDHSNWYNPDGQPSSIRTDIFGAGAVFYQMLTGLPPIWKDDQIVANDDFKGLPVELQEMITRMLSHGQEAQYASFDQIILEIEGLLAAYNEKKAPLKENQALTQCYNAGPSRRQRVMGKRLLQAVLLLGLLLVTAVVCVRHADNFKTYMNEILALWGKFT